MIRSRHAWRENLEHQLDVLCWQLLEGSRWDLLWGLIWHAYAARHDARRDPSDPAGIAGREPLAPTGGGLADRRTAADLLLHRAAAETTDR